MTWAEARKLIGVEYDRGGTRYAVTRVLDSPIGPRLVAIRRVTIRGLGHVELLARIPDVLAALETATP